MAPYVLSNRTQTSSYTRSFPTHLRLPRRSLQTSDTHTGFAARSINFLPDRRISAISIPPYIGVGPVLIHPSPTSPVNALSSVPSSDIPSYTHSRLAFIAVIFIPISITTAIFVIWRWKHGRQKPAQRKDVNLEDQRSLAFSSVQPQVQVAHSCAEMERRCVHLQLPRDRIRAMNSVPSSQVSLTKDIPALLSSSMHQESTPLFFSTVPSTPESQWLSENCFVACNTPDLEPSSPLSLSSPKSGFSDHPSTPVTPTIPITIITHPTLNSSFLPASLNSSREHENHLYVPQEMRNTKLKDADSEARYTWDFKCQGVVDKKNCLSGDTSQKLALDSSDTNSNTLGVAPVIPSDGIVSEEVLSATKTNGIHEYTVTASVPTDLSPSEVEKKDMTRNERLIPLSTPVLELVVDIAVRDNDNDTTPDTTCATLVADAVNPTVPHTQSLMDGTSHAEGKISNEIALLLPELELISAPTSADSIHMSRQNPELSRLDTAKIEETFVSPESIFSAKKRPVLSVPGHRKLTPASSSLKIRDGLSSNQLNATSSTDLSLDTKTTGILTSTSHPKLANIQFGSTRIRASRARAESNSETFVSSKPALTITIPMPKTLTTRTTDSKIDSCYPLEAHLVHRADFDDSSKDSEADLGKETPDDRKNSMLFLRSSFSLPASVELASLSSASRRFKSKRD